MAIVSDMMKDYVSVQEHNQSLDIIKKDIILSFSDSEDHFNLMIDQVNNEIASLFNNLEGLSGRLSSIEKSMASNETNKNNAESLGRTKPLEVLPIGFLESRNYVTVQAFDSCFQDLVKKIQNLSARAERSEQSVAFVNRSIAETNKEIFRTPQLLEAVLFKIIEERDSQIAHLQNKVSKIERDYRKIRDFLGLGIIDTDSSDDETELDSQEGAAKGSSLSSNQNTRSPSYQATAQEEPLTINRKRTVKKNSSLLSLVSSSTSSDSDNSQSQTSCSDTDEMVSEVFQHIIPGLRLIEEQSKTLTHKVSIGSTLFSLRPTNQATNKGYNKNDDDDL